MSPWTALGVMLLALFVGATLNAASLVETASSNPPGVLRDVAVWVAERLLDVSSAAGLDRPRSIIDDLVHDGSGRAIEPREPGAVFVPTTEHRAMLLVAGDSLVDPFGPALVNAAERTGMISADWEVQYSSGLTRPLLFDWQTHLASRLDETGFDMVVFMIGANDAQPIETSTGWASTGTVEWAAEYRSRVGALMDQLTAAVPTVYWVGQPIARSAEHSARMAAVNEIYRAEAESRSGVRYLDAWLLFADAAGRYNAYLPDDHGRTVLMRQDDGIHLTHDGAERLAREVLDSIRADWEIAR